MSPSDKAKYEEIYTANRDGRGEVTFHALEPLFSSLDNVPDTDIRSAWNLVNIGTGEGIGKDACLAFLHILNGRSEGYRIPRSVPASLRATFERGNIQYNVERVQSPAQRWGASRDDDTLTGRKAKFGDTYLSRLGVGERKVKGTDFSSVQTTEDWEEVRLKKQLRELEEKIERVEKAAEKRHGGRRDTTPALVKRELEQLLDYKRRELRSLESGDGQKNGAGSLRGVKEDIETVKEQVDGLEQHLRRREDTLADLRRQIDAEKAGR